MKQKNKLPEPEWKVVSRNTKPKDGYILIHKTNETIQMRMDDDRSMEQRMEEKQSKKAQKKETTRAKKEEKRIAKKQKLLSERYQIDYDEEDEDEDENEDYDEDYDEEYEEELAYEVEEIYQEEEWEDDIENDEEDEDEEDEDEDEWEEESPKDRRLKRASPLGQKKEPIQKGTLYAKVVGGEYAVLTYQATRQAITYQLYDGLFEEEDFCDLMIEKIPYEIEEEGTVDDERELYECFHEAYPWFIKKKVEIIPIFSSRWLSRSAHGVIYDIAPFKKREYYHHIQD